MISVPFFYWRSWIEAMSSKVGTGSREDNAKNEEYGTVCKSMVQFCLNLL